MNLITYKLCNNTTKHKTHLLEGLNVRRLRLHEGQVTLDLSCHLLLGPGPPLEASVNQTCSTKSQQSPKLSPAATTDTRDTWYLTQSCGGPSSGPRASPGSADFHPSPNEERRPERRRWRRGELPGLRRDPQLKCNHCGQRVRTRDQHTSEGRWGGRLTS